MRTTTSRRVLAVALLGSLGISACGGDPNPVDVAAAQETDPAAETTTTETASNETTDTTDPADTGTTAEEEPSTEARGNIHPSEVRSKSDAIAFFKQIAPNFGLTAEEIEDAKVDVGRVSFDVYAGWLESTLDVVEYPDPRPTSTLLATFQVKTKKLHTPRSKSGEKKELAGDTLVVAVDPDSLYESHFVVGNDQAKTLMKDAEAVS